MEKCVGQESSQDDVRIISALGDAIGVRRKEHHNRHCCK